MILSGLADIPIVLTFLTIGLLLWVYYQAHPDPTLPKTPNETFCHFGFVTRNTVRGLDPGIFAPAMGSLSTAINALATSFTPLVSRTQSDNQQPEQSLRAVRWATVWFSILMIIVASMTSYLVIGIIRRCESSQSCSGYSDTRTDRCSSFCYAGCSPSGAATTRKHHGDDHKLHRRAVASGLPNNIADLFGGKLHTQPSWLPVMKFPWWICFGTIVTFSVAILFRTGYDNSRPARTE